MTEEIWKHCYICDYYEISNFGNVRTSDTKTLRKLHFGNRNYYSVLLKYKNFKKNCSVHRLVLMTFKPDEYFEGAFVNHINGIKTDNRLENLEWCTHIENMKHAKEHGLIKKGQDQGNSRLTNDDVIEIRSMYKLGASQVNLSKVYNVTQSLISLIVNNKMWIHLTEIKDINDIDKYKLETLIIKKLKVDVKTPKPRHSNKPPKEQLHEDMNNLPWTEIGKKYGVSNNAAKKWAKGYGLDIENKPYIIINKNNNPSPNKKYNTTEEKQKAKNERKRIRYNAKPKEERQLKRKLNYQKHGK